MRTHLSNLSFINQHNPIGIFHRCQTVGNDQRRTAHGQLVKAGLNLLLRDGIQSGGCLIQNQNLGILQEDTGNGNALLLTA